MDPHALLVPVVVALLQVVLGAVVQQLLGLMQSTDGIGNFRGRNNSKISGSQQDYLAGNSGSPHICVVVIWPRFKQNNMTKKIDQYSQYFW